MNALFTVIGIVVGAILTFFLTRRQESEKHKRAMITQAYADYLCGVAESAHLNPESNEAEILAQIADAKSRICLYGSPEVVALLAAFENAGASTVTPAQHELFASLVMAMRGDSKIQRADLETVLFGSRAT